MCSSPSSTSHFPNVSTIDNFPVDFSEITAVKYLESLQLRPNLEVGPLGDFFVDRKKIQSRLQIADLSENEFEYLRREIAGKIRQFFALLTLCNFATRLRFTHANKNPETIYYSG